MESAKVMIEILNSITTEDLKVFNELPLANCLRKFVENSSSSDTERKELVEKICTGYHIAFGKTLF